MKPGRKPVERGPEGCTDADLLAILVGSGGRGYSAEDVARGLLARHGTLAAPMGRPLREVAGVRGIGAVKAIRLAAAYELARGIVADLERNG